MTAENCFLSCAILCILIKGNEALLSAAAVERSISSAGGSEAGMQDQTDMTPEKTENGGKK